MDRTGDFDLAQVINLSPWYTAERIADDLTRRCGLSYFTRAEPDGPSFRLDPDKLDRVVELAGRDTARRAPWLAPSEQDLAVCRRLLRRTLIRRLAVGMVEAGF